ncbi:MAG: glycosyltransferase [Oscillochloris sp.]|nr:glycosyltransferase [Oscillochloris sp.]
MTLTSEPYSLVSGGIESMALGKPTILSNQPVLIDYFSQGAIFVEHTAESIAEGVGLAQAQEQRLRDEIAQLAVVKLNTWNNARDRLLALIAAPPEQRSRLFWVPKADTTSWSDS